jgi:hypothetical protein
MIDSENIDLVGMSVSEIRQEIERIVADLLNDVHEDETKFALLNRIRDSAEILSTRATVGNPAIASSFLEQLQIEAEADVRYWEDATVNGVEDGEGSLIPGRDGDLWRVRINLTDGRVEDWPEGTTARIFYKVCDGGEYWLRIGGVRVAKWKGYYVPDEFLCHGKKGLGDYIILSIDGKGFVQDYVKPKFDPTRWVPA